MTEWPRLAGVTITGACKPGFETILNAEAVAFITELQRRFNPERKRLLEKRVERQARLDAGEKPDFLPETKHIREGDWTVAPLPDDILDRRVEITGPVDRKMVINALNSGAYVFMADFDDASTPSWDILIDGHINLIYAYTGVIEIGIALRCDSELMPSYNVDILITIQSS